LGGQVHLISNNSNGMIPYGSRENWEALSSTTASKILELARKYEEMVVFCVDTPFMKVPYLVNLQNITGCKINLVNYLQSDVFIHEPENPSFERIGWEAQAIKYAQRSANVKIADVCDFMTNHFIKEYGLVTDNFVKLTMGLSEDSERFIKHTEEEIKSFLSKYKIPLDKKLIFSVARAVDYKGFDILIRACSKLKTDAHLVFVASPYKTEDSCVLELKDIIQKTGITCTAIFECDFDLPKYICQWKNTQIVAQLAKYEPFGLVPEEARIWAKNAGPVVLTSDRDGFVEQIEDGIDGFKVPIEDSDAVAKKIDEILSMESKELDKIRENGYFKFKNNYDYKQNLINCLNHYFSI